MVRNSLARMQSVWWSANHGDGHQVVGSRRSCAHRIRSDLLWLRSNGPGSRDRNFCSLVWYGMAWDPTAQLPNMYSTSTKQKQTPPPKQKHNDKNKNIPFYYGHNTLIGGKTIKRRSARAPATRSVVLYHHACICRANIGLVPPAAEPLRRQKNQGSENCRVTISSTVAHQVVSYRFVVWLAHVYHSYYKTMSSVNCCPLAHCWFLRRLSCWWPLACLPTWSKEHHMHTQAGQWHICPTWHILPTAFSLFVKPTHWDPGQTWTSNTTEHSRAKPMLQSNMPALNSFDCLTSRLLKNRILRQGSTHSNQFMQYSFSSPSKHA